MFENLMLPLVFYAWKPLIFFFVLIIEFFMYNRNIKRNRFFFRSCLTSFCERSYRREKCYFSGIFYGLLLDVFPVRQLYFLFKPVFTMIVVVLEQVPSFRGSCV